MMPIAITSALILLSAFLLIVWDIYVCAFNDIPNRKDSISGQMKTFGEKLRALPFGWGVLGGHFWWPGQPVIPQPGSLFLLVGIAAIITFAFPRTRWLALPALVLGIVCGHLLWPQA